MAGSMRWFTYTADSGDTFALFADESNTENANPGAGIVGPAIIYSIPRNLKPRYAVYQSADGRVTRKCYCLTVAALAAVPGGFTDTVSGEDLTLRYTRGEAVRRPQLVDSGLNDGDAI